MNSRIATVLLIAASAEGPVATTVAAERYSPHNGYHGDLTLLRGPNVTTPARPAGESTPSQTQARVYLGDLDYRTKKPGELVSPNAEIALARHKLAVAQERLKQLQAERAAALTRRKALNEAQNKPIPVSPEPPPAKSPDSAPTPKP